MSDYNYDNFSADDYNFEGLPGPQIGEKAFDFVLMTPDGQPRNLLDFEGDFLVLELGSITCPLFQGRRKIMARLGDEFPQITNVVLYIREAHPGQNISVHKDLNEKLSRAQMLRDIDGEHRLIMVDDFKGQAHKAYGSMPNAVFIINKHGCVVYRATWNNANATQKALRSLINGEKIRAKSYFRPAPPAIALHTLKRAGEGAMSDFLKSLPYLIWQNLIKRNLHLFFNRTEYVDSNIRC